MATIRKRNDKWNVQIRRRGFPAISKSFVMKGDAQSWARKTEAELDRGEMPQEAATSSLATFGDLLEKYEAEVTPRKRGARFERSRLLALRAHPIARRPLKNITPNDFALYRNERLRAVSGSTVRRELTILRHCFEVGRKEWGIKIAPNPVAEIDRPKDGKPRDRRLSESEFESLERALSVCRNVYVRVIYRFAIETGMRRGGILSLAWGQVDLDNRTALLPLTKNGDARIVPLSPAATEILRELKSKKKETLKDLVFPVSANAFQLSWERVKLRAQIENFRFHDLRHEAISRFFELGLSVPEVSLISGHKDARMLFRYTHLKPENVAKKIEALTQR